MPAAGRATGCLVAYRNPLPVGGRTRQLIRCCLLARESLDPTSYLARIAVASLLLLLALSACRGSDALRDCSGAISWDEAWKYSYPILPPEVELEEQLVRGPVMNTLAGELVGGADILYVGHMGPRSWAEYADADYPHEPPLEYNPDGSAKALVVATSDTDESRYEGKTICVRGVIRANPQGRQSSPQFWMSISASRDDMLILE